VFENRALRAKLGLKSDELQKGGEKLLGEKLHGV
jgi:hypothetical protein